MPVGDDTIAYRRHLPHLTKPGKTFFVTFRTRNGFVLPPASRRVALETFIELHEVSCWLHCAVVMPDHVHLLVMPFESTNLSTLMKQLKGGSSYRINRVLGRTGPLWQHESFDHILRSDETLRMKADYICDNPVRAGLVQSSSEYRWLWRAADERPAG